MSEQGKGHDAAVVEAVAKEVGRVIWGTRNTVGALDRKAACFILDREAPLLAALERAREWMERSGHCGPEYRDVNRALAAHRATTRPAEPTRTVKRIMVDVSRNVIRVPQGSDPTMLSHTLVPTYLWDELAAALARERGAK